jgi:hypothetical protein
MVTQQKKFRALLFAGVSVIALAVATPEVGASDLPPPPPIVTKAKAQVCKPITTMFIEGAAFRSAGDKLFLPGSSFITGFFDFGEGFESFPGVSGLGSKPRWGWEAAGGIDYQFACSPWHVSVDFRYGQAKSKTKNASLYLSYPFYDYASGQLKHKEQHWAADFMVGRDVGLGSGKSQLKVGVRVADLRAKTTANGSISYYYNYAYGYVTAAGSLRQTSKFLGVGPRIALEGSIPFVQQGPLAIDYSVGAAALWGERKLSLNAAATTFCCGSFAASFSSNKDGVIPNVDASLALAYSMTPNSKISVGYRFDGYWDVLRTFNKNGSIVNADRFFHGPFVRVTGTF